MRHLLLYIHGDESNAKRLYADALRPCGDVDIVFVFSGAASSAYTAEGQRHRDGNGRVLPRLRARWLPPTFQSRQYETTNVVSFSAGYALVRELFHNNEDRNEIDSYIALDSVHASTIGTPAANAQLAGFAEFARQARDGAKLFWLAHTTVPTYGYASTTEVAKELVRIVGAPAGHWNVRSFSPEKPSRTAAQQRAEHSSAQMDWGPAFVAEALVPYLGNGWRGTPDSGPSVTFSQALLAAAYDDLNAGIREVGHNAGPAIERLYLKPLGLAPGQSYCAAAVTSWLRRAETRSGIKSPIPGSAGAKTIMAQLQAAGRWKARGRYTRSEIVPGCIAVWDRSTPGKPDTNWFGHVGIVVDCGNEVFWTVEANADRPPPCDAVCQVERRLDDPKLLGFGFVD